MSNDGERVAVIEAESRRNQKDINSLHKMFRTHMEREEKDRSTIMNEIHDLKEMHIKQKSFVGGIVLTVSALWAIGAALYQFFKTGGGH